MYVRFVLGIATAVLLLVGRATAQPMRQVVTSEEIRASGVVRLHELVELVDGWTYVSMDGFRGWSLPLGEGTWGGAGWDVWVDGHPVDFDLLGTHMLDRLPVLLQDLAYVEVVRGPAVERGPLAPRGRLHLHTRRPDEGLGARGTYWVGNATGDPGPYRYLQGGGHNVDRLGSDIEVTGEGRQAWGWFRAQALTRIHFPTHRATFDRLADQLPGEYPKSEMLASAVQVRLEADDGAHDLWGGVSKLTDFVYLEPYLREVPAQSLFARLGANGRTSRLTPLHLDYHAAATINQLGRRPTEPPLDPSLQVAVLRAGLEAQLHAARLQARLGGRLRHETASAAVPLADATYTVGTVYASVTGRPSGLQPSAALQAQVTGSDVALQGHLAVSSGRGRWAWTAWLGYEERLFGDGHRLWLWTRRGYPLLDTLGVDYALNEAYANGQVLRTEAEVRVRLDSSRTLSAGLFVRDHHGLILPERTLTRYDEAGRYFEGRTMLVGDVDGTLAGGFARAALTWTPWLRQHYFVSIQHRVRGGARFDAAWRTRPVVQVQVRTTLRPAPTFTLNGRVAYSSRTRWPGLDAAAFLSGGAFGDRLPASVVLDLAATKWLWNRRIRGSLGVRNVLNKAYRQHPLGAAFPLSLRIQVSAIL